MKKRISLIAAPLAASAILLSSNAFASSDTKIGVSYGDVVVGDTEFYDAIKADDALAFTLKHDISNEFYLEGKYLTSKYEESVTTISGESDEVTMTESYDFDLDQVEAGAGFTIDTGNSIFDTLRAGGGYFKHSYDYSEGESEEAEGFYLKTGVDVQTGVSGLTLGGEYTYYVGELEIEGLDDFEYEYGVTTVSAEYSVNSAIDLNAAADFADSESGYRVGIAYKF